MSFDVKGYEPLADVLELAFDRSARGKGRERHADQRHGDQPFLEQTICNVVVMLGEHAWDGQIIKKILEADRLDPEAGDRELADAIVYIAARLAVRRALRKDSLTHGEAVTKMLKQRGLNEAEIAAAGPFDDFDRVFHEELKRQKARPPVIIHSPAPLTHTGDPEPEYPNWIPCLANFCGTPTKHYHPINPHPTLQDV